MLHKNLIPVVKSLKVNICNSFDQRIHIGQISDSDDLTSTQHHEISTDHGLQNMFERLI